MIPLCSFLIVLFLSAYPTNTSFLNLGYLLEPILRPQVDTFGSTIYHDNTMNSDYLKPFDERQKSKNLLNNGQFQLMDSQRSRRNKNLRTEDLKPAQDLYKTIGISQDIIYNRILPIHMKVKKILTCYFYKSCTTKWQLYKVLKELKEMILWVQKTYLKDINNVVLGDNTQITGHNVYVAAGQHKIEGSSDFVFSPKFSNKVVKGNNIVRVDGFDIYLDQIGDVNKFDVKKAVLPLAR